VSPNPTETRKPAKPRAKPHGSGDAWVDRVVATYGDLLYDFCQSLLWSPVDAPDAFRTILRKLVSLRKTESFTKYERPWILQVAFRELRGMKRRNRRALTPAEQVMLDSNPDPRARQRFFDSYFHRLPMDSQLLLLLRDKYGLPLSEVAAVLEIPEASARLQRIQALRLLESWIWSGVDGPDAPEGNA
jgi:DNA-directed RNA polymerase specialized sigma24 family protein